MREIRIMGVDPSIAKPLGISLVTERLTVEHSGLFALEEIPNLMKEWKPDLVVVEDQYLSFNYNTAKKLAWCAGKIMGIALFLGVPCEIMNVAHWKKIMSCQPKDKKDKTAHIRRCTEIFREEYEDDVASAILIATTYLTENKFCDII